MAGVQVWRTGTGAYRAVAGGARLLRPYRVAARARPVLPGTARQTHPLRRTRADPLRRRPSRGTRGDPRYRRPSLLLRPPVRTGTRLRGTRTDVGRCRAGDWRLAELAVSRRRGGGGNHRARSGPRPPWWPRSATCPAAAPRPRAR